MKILSGWQWGKDDAIAQINLRKNAEKYPDLQFVAGACNVLIGDLYLKIRDFGNARAAYERVAKNPDAGEYKRLAQQRLDELRKISSRRS